MIHPMAVSSSQPMRQLMATTVDAQRFVSVVSGGFAIIALFLAGVGLYGVLGLYILAERRTIAIRMALGGSPRAIASLVMRGARCSLSSRQWRPLCR
jgi:ABC-type antimicrobial peptide transport system permease subunit